MSLNALEASSPVRASGELIQSVASNRDPRAFTILFQTYRPQLIGYFLRFGIDQAAAEELTQDALLAIWRSAHQFDPRRASAVGWIFGIARNLRIDRMRRRHARGDETGTAQPPPLGGADWAEPSQAGLELYAALGSLKQSDAEVLGMALVEGWTHSQIAERLQLPLGTVKSRLRRSAERLRKRLDANAPTPA